MSSGDKNLPFASKLDTESIGVTAIITTFNEEKNIEKCVQSVMWADEILVVDSFSTDTTVDICKRFGATVLQRKYKYAAEQKNWAIPQAKHPWIILLDADEVADKNLENEVRTLLNTGPYHTAYWIKRKNYFLGKLVRFCGWQNDRVIRFFHRDSHLYENIMVHEEIAHSEKIGTLKAKILHFTAENLLKYDKKIERYANYAAKQNILRNKKVNWFHLYIKPLYKFLHSYFIRGGIFDGTTGFIICHLRAKETWLKAYETKRLKELKKEDKNQIPIDAVITWVDNGDAKHLEKLFDYLPESNIKAREEFKKRFIEVEELKYVVHSILKYASFIRSIFIVTDNQRPKFLDANTTGIYAKVKVIDHKEIFKGDTSYLPVFNSRSIETKLYNIPNLSEHFIYFNDDIFLIKPVKPSHFFYKEEPVIRGKWNKFKEDVFYKKLVPKKNIEKPKHGIAQDLSAKTIGFKKVFRFQHTPIPMRRSTIKNFFATHRNLEIKNIQHKFRNKEQFLIQGIANHLEIKNKSCVALQDYQLVKITSYKRSRAWLYVKLALRTQQKNKLFLNIQELNLYSESSKNFVLNWLENRYKL